MFIKAISGRNLH